MATKVGDNDSAHLHELGRQLRENGEFAKAAHTYNLQLEHHPEDLRAVQHLVSIFMVQGYVNKALDLLNKYLDADTLAPGSLLEKALRLQRCFVASIGTTEFNPHFACGKRIYQSLQEQCPSANSDEDAVSHVVHV